MKRSRRSLFAPVLAVPALVAPALVALALVALALAAPALGAQRGGQPPVPPAQQPPRPGDTTLVRRTPDGFVLDFQNVDINVVLAAIAEAGGLNVTYANIPNRRVTLRMAQAVTKEQALDVLRGVVESNGLKITESAALIRIEGPPPTPTLTPQQQLQQAAQQQPQLRLYTYRLKHANATQLAPVLMSLVTGTTGVTGVTGVGGRAGVPGLTIFGGGVPGAAGAAAPAAPGGGRAGGGRGGDVVILPQVQVAPGGGRGGGAAAQALVQALQQQVLQQALGVGPLSTSAAEIRIVAEESTNSLLVRATEADWVLIQQVLQAVDLRPLQALIEVTIALVQRTHDLNVGISGSQTRARGTSPSAPVDTTLLLASAATARDFVYLLTGGKGTINYKVALNALQTRGNVKVLSLPVIIAQNNKEALLNVGSSVPFVQITQRSGIDPTGTVQTIQYIDVGTTLTITPTINPDGYVNLAVKQTNNAATNDVQFNAPVISKREATTTIFIRDGQTSVIGGLSDATQDRSTSGIPFLSRIPFIGGLLFGNTTRTEDVSELYLFLTPHIISSDEDIDRLREAVKGQSELLQGVNVEARIVPKGDTIQIGTPTRPRPDSAAKARPDSAKRPPGDSVKKRPPADSAPARAATRGGRAGRAGRADTHARTMSIRG
ncbi:MAG TPA: secretin N-terminal domain-containing protein [Gemmatimonadaceae bacterium]|nr:secretin N-terminal domain-containing protein [Gemmatimonadaceae bacterium]